MTARERYLEASWLGLELSLPAMRELQARGVDACGENGEYHTLVIDSPVFSSPLPVLQGERVQRGPVWALDVELTVEAVSC